ncbi:hypothetical protein Tco_1290723, partial [Tanacetum coccineum]
FHRPLILLQIVQLILFIVDSGCTKNMTGNLKLLCKSVEKFLGTVRFGNRNDVWTHQFKPRSSITRNSRPQQLTVKFKAGSKSCSSSSQDSYITTSVGITIPPSHSNAEDNSNKVVRLGINPMIQPEPEDLPKDNPKLEIAVLSNDVLVSIEGVEELKRNVWIKQSLGMIGDD